ncbi:hypothetical protein PILCRDRAFT_15859 [Piloderma croceum F 1598]|uniref:Uncharacterized protein n=1 Tax=Piloderma croceum (strain F 1598) TaxID=765440 RepID=A0A0C3AFZ1_PILCF|nr:hypothetical protein PILCRDRAFT_15859 [Piloderma croceum F 1598]
MTPNSLNCLSQSATLEHHHSYVRKNTTLVVYAIYCKFKNLMPNALELIAYAKGLVDLRAQVIELGDLGWLSMGYVLIPLAIFDGKSRLMSESHIFGQE